MISLWIAQASAAAAPPSADGGGGWLVDPELVEPSYTQTMAGGTIQTAFPPPPPPPNTPEWLEAIFRAIGDFFEWSAPSRQALAVDRRRPARAAAPLSVRSRLRDLGR
ncbi:hypothetical protein [Sphingopyxis sp. PET50]|uniref:hypothetical protein n=1 Tax=Sphingopyxis sp. PET50 TaxID=2976533 RepID=UPI0021B02FEC|nr:hypothetical protein [Sphingopyxis sp. PET50]